MSSIGTSRRSVSRTRIRDTERVVVRESYYWPDQQLNAWILVMLATGGTLIGVNALFIIQQQHLGFGLPWIFTFGIIVGSFTVLFIFAMLILIYQRILLPGLAMIASFILLVLYITGLVETAIQLFGPAGDVNDHCNNFVSNYHAHGPSIATLAWLQQNSICSSWYAVFAFWIIGAVFLLWMIILGSMVARGIRRPEIRY